MPCHTANVTCVPNGNVTGSVKLTSPTAKNSTAATAPTNGFPVIRQPTTAVSRIARADSAGIASRSATTGRSMPAIRLVEAMWAWANQW